MTKRTYQLYASISASGDALASILLPVGGRLKTVLWQITPNNAVVSNDYLQTEISVNSARQVSTNEATGIISVCGAQFSCVTSGGGTMAVTVETHPDVSLKTGDKLYLHATEAGTATWLVRAIIFLE